MLEALEVTIFRELQVSLGKTLLERKVMRKENKKRMARESEHA
jgi:hypothetical protein